MPEISHGPAGEISVLDVATDGGIGIDFLIHNGTDETQVNIGASLVIRDEHGELYDLSTGRSHVRPNHVEPGQWAMGYILTDDPPPGATLEWTFESDPNSPSIEWALGEIDISETTIRSDYNTKIVGTFTNPQPVPAEGNFMLGCFDADGHLLEVMASSTDAPIPVGGSAPFEIETLGASCASAVIVTD